MELRYRVNGNPVEYKVQLVSVPSNIGKGQVWYLFCPVTYKRCRKLYCVAGKFLHRLAYSGCMYESQIRSHKYRLLDKVYGPAFKLDEYYVELYRKHFRTHYAGKPTRKYLRLMNFIQRGERITPQQMEALYMV